MSLFLLACHGGGPGYDHDERFFAPFFIIMLVTERYKSEKHPSMMK